VVICDLIFKLEELKDIYNDSAATKILKEIEEKQKENPRSPDWESNIIQLIKDRTSLLELFEIDAILQLQKQRHLSAHPILTEISILFTPNKETITAHIKNMLSFVLTKPPIFSRRFATSIIIDISENRDKLIINKYLQRYLEAKYFKNARQELLDNLFKTLWKFTFQTKNEECDTNREINYLALEIIYNRNRDGIEKFIKSEQGNFNFKSEKKLVDLFMTFLFDYPKIYHLLSNPTQILIDSEISAQEKYKFLSWFKFPTFEEYFELITRMVKDNFCPSVYFFSKVFDLSNQFGKKGEFFDLAIEMFGKSGSFYDSDNKFSGFIAPFLEDFSEEQLNAIIIKINDNGQIYSRRRASFDNRKIKEAMNKINPEFDYSKYLNFK